MTERETVIKDLLDFVADLSPFAGNHGDWAKVHRAIKYLKESAFDWIETKDRPPDTHEPVIVYVPPYEDKEKGKFMGYVGMAYYTKFANGGYWFGTDGNLYGAIGMIHPPILWMERPKPPKEVNNA